VKRRKPFFSEENAMTAGRLLLGLIVALFLYYQLRVSPSFLGSAQGKVLLAVTLAYLAYTIAPVPLVTKLFSVVCAVLGAYIISSNNLKFGLLLIGIGVLSFWGTLDGAKAKTVKERE
jgi:hypothetical protein